MKIIEAIVIFFFFSWIAVLKRDQGENNKCSGSTLKNLTLYKKIHAS